MDRQWSLLGWSLDIWDLRVSLQKKFDLMKKKQRLMVLILKVDFKRRLTSNFSFLVEQLYLKKWSFSTDGSEIFELWSILLVIISWPAIFCLSLFGMIRLTYSRSNYLWDSCQGAVSKVTVLISTAVILKSGRNFVVGFWNNKFWCKDSW